MFMYLIIVSAEIFELYMYEGIRSFLSSKRATTKKSSGFVVGAGGMEMLIH